MKKIGIVGVGIMGSGMASNFLKNGYEVYIFNRSKDKVKDLINKGAVLLSSPKEVAQKSDIIFEVTADDNSSRGVWLLEEGILAGSNENKILIASSTLSVNWVQELARICENRKFNFLDIPLTGGRGGAESGKLIMLAGGDKNKLEEIKNELKAISEQTFYFGPVSSGTKFKLLLNMIQGVHMVAFGEAMKIAEENNLDIDMVGDVLALRMGGATAIGWRDYKNSPEQIKFGLGLVKKDLSYAKIFANKIDTPLLNETLKKFEEAVQNGKANLDWTAINKK